MILMALFSMVLIFGMPYLMENSTCYPDSMSRVEADNYIVDPETKAEFEEMQKKSPIAAGTNPAQQLQNFDLASWMAGKTDTGSSTTRTESPAPQTRKRG
jgi:hypothetical protein